MNSEREILQRVNTLEIELRHAREDLAKLESTAEKEIAKMDMEIKELERKVAYYDKMALKWGWFIMGIIAFGALVAGKADKLIDKLLGRVL
jgi:hypothetical protein